MLLCTVQCLEGPRGARTRACVCSRVVTKVVRGKEIGAVSGCCD